MAVQVLKNNGPRVPQVFHETGLLITERKASWHKSGNESEEREEELWTQTEELGSQNKVDKITQNDLADDLRQLKK